MVVTAADVADVADVGDFVGAIDGCGVGVVVEVGFGSDDGVLDWAVVGGVVDDGRVCVGVQLTNVKPKNSAA